ncbi:MAG: radical SAM protein [Nitrospirae bacterium]|nr:radical SAM protein [Nitrospirota bacterium]
MRYYLSPHVCLKRLETPSVYHLKTDELYELDESSFSFLKTCSAADGCLPAQEEFMHYCVQEGIFVSEYNAIQRPPVMKAPEPSLRYLELQITDRCNLRCKHCYIAPLSSERSGEGPVPEVFHELSVDQIRTILREFEELQGLRVMITGGEPLLHKDFTAINTMLPDFLIRKVLFSNGLLLNRGLLRGLHLDEIQISIDGLEQAHDIIRGAGTFARSMDSIRLCLEMGYEVSISTMVHADNLDDFDEMETLFRKMGIRDWTVDVPCISGRLLENEKSQVPPQTGGKYLAYGFGEGLHGGGEGFGCGLHLMSVMADGKISKCTFYADKSVGTVHDGLGTCWRKITPVRLRDLTCDCAYLAACRGGCRYRAEMLGDACGKDLYRCALYDIMKTEK